MNRLLRIIIGFLFFTAGVVCGAEEPIPDSLRELARLKQESNIARLEALKEILKAHGISYELQSFTSPASSPHGRTQGTNVVINFGKGKREITVGAHYDVLELKNGAMVDGMVDNGAGVITLVRVAEALKGRKLRNRVRIVLFDMEEIGMIGSKSYVDARRQGIAAAINLDVVAFGDSAGYGFGKAAGTGRVQRALLMSCADHLLTCMDFANFPASDDRSFQTADIPVVSIGFAPRIVMHQAWLLLNGGENSGLKQGFIPELFKMIHSQADTIKAVEPATLDRSVPLVLDVILRLDAALK